MSAAGSGGVETLPSTGPGDLLVSGLRRGALLVFLPVLVAGQALAWLTYAASRWYHPWSWFKIGLAETLSSVRVPFSTAVSATSLARLVSEVACRSTSFLADQTNTPETAKNAAPARPKRSPTSASTERMSGTSTRGKDERTVREIVARDGAEGQGATA